MCVVMSVLVEELLEEEEREKSEHLEVVKAVTVKNGAVITTDKVFNRDITKISKLLQEKSSAKCSTCS